MGLKPIRPGVGVRTEGPKGEKDQGPVPTAGGGYRLCAYVSDSNYGPIFSKSRFCNYSRNLQKKERIPPCLKANNFRFRNFFATCVVETNPNQNGRSTGRSKQASLDRPLDRTARQADGQTARQDVREKTPAPSWEPNRVQKNTTSRILLAAN